MCSISSCSRVTGSADLDGPRSRPAAGPGDPLGEVGEADLGAVGEDRGAARSALRSSRRLPGQGWRASASRASGVNPVSRRPVWRAKKASRWPRGRDVGPVAERGQGQLDDVEPVEQVFAEGPRGDRRLEVAVGRRDQPDVGRPGPGLADPLVLPLLEEPQELGLEGRGEVADLVEEERPPLGAATLPGDVADGAGEGAPGVAEEVALEQLGAEARAAHRDERAVGPLAPGVQRAGEDPLAGAVLAADQDDGVGRGDPPGQVEDAADLGVAAFQVDLGHLAADLVLQVGHPVAEPPDPRRPARARRGPGPG